MTTANDERQPLISIIMPAYNAEETIAESIQSVIDQTYQNWELIIVNDGSTDQTLQVTQTYNDKRIHLISKENSGVADSRNQAIQQASGLYIAFLDSDDLWIPEKLQKQLFYFESQNNNLGLVHSNYIEFDQNGEHKPKPFKHTKKSHLSGNVSDQLMIHDFIATLTVMTKKKLPKEDSIF